MPPKTQTPEDAIDVSLPGRSPLKGALHPVSQIQQEICDIFSRLGFDVAEGPEVESDYYNFEALNFPKNHPARDMQDTFFVSDDIVLRTHTSPLQIRIMEKTTPPRSGCNAREGISLRFGYHPYTHVPSGRRTAGRHRYFLRGPERDSQHLYSSDVRRKTSSLRFRPSFFPFTEPSAEVDILCVMCRGLGCRICSQTGWLEILGSGMVHPALYENVGYPSGKYTGFAFGMGVERIAMLKYGIDDIRKFFENDTRFLQQF